MTAGELPQAALGPVSAALGAAEPSYHVRARRLGRPGVNRGQGFAASFAAGGVQGLLEVARASSMRTTAAGFGSSPAALAPVTPAGVLQPRHLRPRRHAGVVRERALRPRAGLHRRRGPPPRSQQGGVYTVTMALSVHDRGRRSRADGRSVLLRAPSGGTLRYGGLRAVDAANRLLPSWLSLRGQTLSLHVRTAGARFPVSIDPLLTGEGLAIELGRGARAKRPKSPQFGTERRAVGRRHDRAGRSTRRRIPHRRRLDLPPRRGRLVPAGAKAHRPRGRRRRRLRRRRSRRRRRRTGQLRLRLQRGPRRATATRP